MKNNNNFSDDYSFVIKDDSGLETKCNIIAVVERQEENPIIVYTDYTLDNENKYNLFASQVIKDGNTYSLQIIENPEEVAGLREELSKIYQENF